MTPQQIKFYYRSNPSLLKWILNQDQTQHIKMRYELEKEVKQGLRSSYQDKAELELLNKLTSGDSSRNYIIEQLKTI